MYGFILITFKPESVGIVGHKLEKLAGYASILQGKSELDTTTLIELRQIFSRSRVGHLRPCMNSDNDNTVTLMGSNEIMVRVGLHIDSRVNKLTAEDTFRDCPTECVSISFWVIINRDRDGNKLRCGTWNDGKGMVGVTVTNDPTKETPSRMNIRVIAHDLASARGALLNTLTGATSPGNPWLV